MSLRIQCVTVDSRDPWTLATFWEAALGWPRTYEDDILVDVEPPGGGIGLQFLKVTDDKTVKNRLHLDLVPDDQAAEIARLESLGARRVEIGQDPGVSWAVLADPEGNEFCVLRPRSPEELLQES